MDNEEQEDYICGRGILLKHFSYVGYEPFLYYIETPLHPIISLMNLVYYLNKEGNRGKRNKKKKNRRIQFIWMSEK